MGVFDWLIGRWRVGARPPQRAVARRFPRRFQCDDYSCAARCTQMILEYYRRPMRYASIKEALGTTEYGTHMAPIARLLRDRGLSVTTYPSMKIRDLERGLARGIVLVFVDTDHVAVAHDIDDRFVYISDPSPMRFAGERHTRADFRKRWDHWGMVVTDPGNGRPTAPLHVPLEAICPIGGDAFDVPSHDGEYVCPHCAEDVVVDDGVAEHVEMDVYRCPVTGKMTGVCHDETRGGEYYACPECGEPVRVQEIDGYFHVLHSLRYQ